MLCLRCLSPETGSVANELLVNESCERLIPILLLVFLLFCTAMAVQKSKKTRSRIGMRRSHDSLTSNSLATDPVSGERHLRHNMSADGFYKGRLVKDLKKKSKESEEEIQQ